ncbi:MAG: chemotaxis protein CheW, partial [Muribaculaceae bacterium]|nr:chemotaxis protein CheW [Muribaculaceae bacterium]
DNIIKEPDGEEFIMIRGEGYPILRLGDLYKLEGYDVNSQEAMVVVIEVDGEIICLLVDKLIGKQEIVVKPIPDYIGKVKGLSGCTQLGDGSIALILDAAGLIE